MEENLSIERYALFNPEDLSEIATTILNGLRCNFKEVSVELVECPNLSQMPFKLASEGLLGNAKLIDLGGVPYLLPTPQKEKLYDLKHIAKLVKSNPSLVIGAGAGPYPYCNTNCEGIYNMYIDPNNITSCQQSRLARIADKSVKPVQLKLPPTETRCALLCNLLISDGLRSATTNNSSNKVFKICASHRTGTKDFITAIRTGLTAKYNAAQGNIIGLGGTFLLRQGKGRFHVMPDFSKEPLNNDEELNRWLHFYDLESPMVAVGTLISDDPGLSLRVQHFHAFSNCNDANAGHYHIDTTPETVQYEGYFTLANEIVRIDRPARTQNFGQD